MENLSISPELRPFLDEPLRLTAFPARRRKKLLALAYLAGRLEAGRVYSEAELGDLLDTWHTFHDPATLRRELYNKHLLSRTEDCRRYWKETTAPLAAFIAEYI